jgi:hypothetical protein
MQQADAPETPAREVFEASSELLAMQRGSCLSVFGTPQCSFGFTGMGTDIAERVYFARTD